MTTSKFIPVLLPVPAALRSKGSLPWVTVTVSPRSGYETLLIQNGVDPFSAKFLALRVRRAGWQVERTAKLRRPVAEAIRFLATPKRQRRAVIKRAQRLLMDWKRTPVVKDILAEIGLGEDPFVRVLESVIRGETEAFGRVLELAAAAMVHLPHNLGRRTSAASASHQFFLEHGSHLLEQAAYTWDPALERCTDALADATRLEFGLPNFDPRPARRRQRAGRRSL